MKKVTNKEAEQAVEQAEAPKPVEKFEISKEGLGELEQALGTVNNKYSLQIIYAVLKEILKPVQ